MTLRTAAHQASLVHGFSLARVLEGVPFASSGDLPDPGIKPVSPPLAGGFFITDLPGKPSWCVYLLPISGLQELFSLASHPQGKFLQQKFRNKIWGKAQLLSFKIGFSKPMTVRKTFRENATGLLRNWVFQKLVKMVLTRNWFWPSSNKFKWFSYCLWLDKNLEMGKRDGQASEKLRKVSQKVTPPTQGLTWESWKVSVS